MLTNLVLIIWTGVWIKIFTECIGTVNSNNLKKMFAAVSVKYGQTYTVKMSSWLNCVRPRSSRIIFIFSNWFSSQGSIFFHSSRSEARDKKDCQSSLFFSLSNSNLSISITSYGKLSRLNSPSTFLGKTRQSNRIIRTDFSYLKLSFCLCWANIEHSKLRCFSNSEQSWLQTGRPQWRQPVWTRILLVILSWWRGRIYGGQNKDFFRDL